MRPLVLEALFRTSSSEVAQSASNSNPNGSVKIAREHSRRAAGSPHLQDIVRADINSLKRNT